MKKEEEKEHKLRQLVKIFEDADQVQILARAFSQVINLRDFFAAAALMGITVRGGMPGEVTEEQTYIDATDRTAQRAYDYADAMIKAREGKE
jgi:hypothetical protein